MLNLSDTPAGAWLEERFAGAGSLEPDLRAWFLGAGRVHATLLLPAYKHTSENRDFIRLRENEGVGGDRRASLVTAVSSSEVVLRYVMGVKPGEVMANLRQVTLVSRFESAAVAHRMGIDEPEMPLGLQAENLVIDELDELELNGNNGFSALPAGAMLTFISPDGIPRTGSLHVVSANVPEEWVHDNMVRYLGNQRPAVLYRVAAAGRCGVAAMVKTAGRVHAGDIVLAWAHH
jgi:hypothetical protein